MAILSVPNKKKVSHRLLSIFLIVIAFFALQWFCKRQTGGFTTLSIHSDLNFHPEWDIAPIGDMERLRLKNILNQPFYYLNKGAQCYVFVSEDQQYVIKFFRFSHLRAPLWLKALPTPFSLKKFRDSKVSKRESKLYKDFSSYKLAHEHLKEETGLEYLHLNKTNFLHQTLTIFDRLHIAHYLDLDKMEFLLQKKATLVYPTLRNWIENKEWEKAKEGVRSLIRLLKYRLDQGIFDKDPDLNTNFGFIGQKAVQIDIGRFRLCQFTENPAHTLERITDHLRQWLEVKAPDLAIFLREEIHTNSKK